MEGGFFKKLTSDAGTVFNRAKQFTEEKLGQAERTELDAHFENLLQRSDKTRQWTENIIGQTAAVIQPNPGDRVQNFVFNKLDKKGRDRQNNLELLGQFMIDAGNEFGPGTSYGSALVKCGQTQQKLGVADKDFVDSAGNNFIQPLQAFLNGDMKTVMKERKILENKRLDLDVAKNKLRRAKTQPSKESTAAGTVMQDDEAILKAESDLRVAQAEFDRQAEITKLLLEGISSTHAHHLRCLHDFIEAQATYYAQCHQYMQDLQRQLGSYSVNSVPSGGGSTSPTIHAPVYPSAPPAAEVSEGGAKQARVLYDYDAADMRELSLVADEVISVYRVPGMEADWMMGQRGTQHGRVPVTYLQIID